MLPCYKCRYQIPCPISIGYDLFIRLILQLTTDLKKQGVELYPDFPQASHPRLVRSYLNVKVILNICERRRVESSFEILLTKIVYKETK